MRAHMSVRICFVCVFACLSVCWFFPACMSERERERKRERGQREKACMYMSEFTWLSQISNIVVCEFSSSSSAETIVPQTASTQLQAQRSSGRDVGPLFWFSFSLKPNFRAFEVALLFPCCFRGPLREEERRCLFSNILITDQWRMPADPSRSTAADSRLKLIQPKLVQKRI